jgi:hypothetical protein
LNPDVDDAKAANLAIKLISEADPPEQATLEISADLRPEDIEKLSWSEALALAERLGIDVSPPPEGDHGLPRSLLTARTSGLSA